MKIKIIMWETVTYTREAIIELPQNTDIEELLDEVEKRSVTPDDATGMLAEMGCSIIQDVDTDLRCPDSEEFEIVEYVEIRE